jgi:hypothetical protein
MPVVFRNVVFALIVIAIGEMLPPLQALERWMASRRTPLVWCVGGICFVGWALFMSAVIYRILTGGGSLTREGIAHQIKSVQDGLRRPYAWRVSFYHIPKWAVGGGFHDEMSIRQFKDAWRLRLWRTDTRWRGVFAMAFGAALMTIGCFGLPVVLGTPGLKLLCGGLLLYAAVRTTGAFLRT